MSDLSGFSITCANKNQSGKIIRIGGQGWSLEIRDALKRIIDNTIKLNITIGNSTYYIGIRGNGDNIYAVLEPGGKRLDDIDGLHSC